MLFRRYKLSYFSFFVCCLKSFFSLNFDFDLFKKKWRKICFVGLPVISLRICSSTSITRRTKLLTISFDVYCNGRAFHFLFAIPSWELDKQYKGIDKQSYKHFNVILNYIIFFPFLCKFLWTVKLLRSNEIANSEDEKQTAWVQSVTKFHFTQIDWLSEDDYELLDSFYKGNWSNKRKIKYSTFCEPWFQWLVKLSKLFHSS